MKKHILFIVLTLWLGISKAGVLPDEFWFSAEWCPKQEEVDELSGYLTLTMNSCCIRVGKPNAKAYANPKLFGKLIERWEHRLWSVVAQNTIASTANQNVRGNGWARFYTVVVNPSVDCVQKEFVAEEEDAIRQAYRREREIEKSKDDRMKEDAKTAMRLMGGRNFCVSYGNAIRGDREYGTDVSDIAKNEAKRRKMVFNEKMVRDEHIRIGISECQMMASWGYPVEQNRSVGPWGMHIQYIYGRHGPYVYIENGRVSSWQD